MVNAPFGCQRAKLDNGVRAPNRIADTRRPGSLHGFHQGVHLPTGDTCLPCYRGWARSGRALGRRRGAAGAGARRCSKLHDVRARARTEDPPTRSQDSTVPQRAFIGRGTNYPLALEGALKLKEITYIHAEGYAAGELKHGPIALIDKNLPVVVIAPGDRTFEKTMSNMHEVIAREGRTILVTDHKGATLAAPGSWAMLTLPDIPTLVAPLVFALPLQLLAYHTALVLGTDVDQPRNLAKSVTVE